MQSSKLDVFFSCSFAASDKDSNDYFLAICKALDMQCINVSTGYAETPPTVAKTQIGNAQALVAICTKRGDLGSGVFTMPDAVHDELSFAFGKDVPVLMIAEEGVQLGGFKSNFGTHLRFERTNLYSPDFLEKAVSALHGLKMQIVSPADLIHDQDISEVHAEYVHHAVEMKELANDYTWTYASSRKLVFSKPYKRSFPTGVWAVLPTNIPSDAAPIAWDLKVEASSRNIDIKCQVEKHTADAMEAILRLDPPAEEGDYVVYSWAASSRYLNHVWLEDAADTTVIHLDRGDFKCADGMIVTQRTKKAILEFRFPRSYGIKPNDINPFVASYTTRVDYEVESELKRLEYRVETFGGNLIVRMEIESPLLRHMYGIAWNPRAKP